ncbi:hypothetical protein SCUP234_01170 [Seiridium cupressi]
MSHLPVPASKSARSVSRGVRNQKDAKTQAIVSNAPQAMSSAQLKGATLGVPIAPRSGTYAEARNRSTTGMDGIRIRSATALWPEIAELGKMGNGEWGNVGHTRAPGYRSGQVSRTTWTPDSAEDGYTGGQLIGLPQVDTVPSQIVRIPNALYGMAVIDGEEKTALLELLQWILAWRPGERQDAEQVLDAAWMKTWALPAYEKSLKLEN